MEEWRVLADTVLDVLLPVASAMTPDVFWMLASAREKLIRCVDSAIRARRGLDVRPIPYQWPRGIGPAAALEVARRRLGILCDCHVQAGNVFRLCRSRVGGQVEIDPLWPEWEARHAAALHHAARAREALRSAAAHTQAAKQASEVTSVIELPAFPVRTAWCSATLNLARRAMWGATTAMVELIRMREALTWECVYVYRILHRPPLPVRCFIEHLRANEAASP